MRKLNAIILAVLITTTASAFAAPNDSTDRGARDPITRIIRIIRAIVHVFDVPEITPPQP